MTELKIFVALVCLVSFVLRLRDTRALPRQGEPGNLRRAKMTFAYASALVALAVLLDIEVVYAWVDGLLGGADYANLVMRALVYSFLFIVGMITARAFNSMLSLWLVKGLPGQVALGVTATVTVVSFALGTHPRLGSYDTLSDTVFVLSWQMYLIYIAFALLACLLPAAMTPGGAPARRIAAALTAAGYTFAIIYPVVRVGRVLFEYDEWMTDLLKMAMVLFAASGGARRLGSEQMAG